MVKSFSTWCSKCKQLYWSLWIFFQYNESIGVNIRIGSIWFPYSGNESRCRCYFYDWKILPVVLCTCVKLGESWRIKRNLPAELTSAVRLHSSNRSSTQVCSRLWPFQLVTVRAHISPASRKAHLSVWMLRNDQTNVTKCLTLWKITLTNENGKGLQISEN